MVERPRNTLSWVFFLVNSGSPATRRVQKGVTIMQPPDPNIPVAPVEPATSLSEPGEPKATDDKVFSQEDINRIVGRRVQEERDKFPNYEEGQAAIVKLAEIAEASKTEDQKTRERLQQTEQELEQQRTANAVLAIETSIKLAATSEGVDADSAIGLIDRTSIKYDAESNNVSGVAEALTALVETKPFLKVGGQVLVAPAINPGGTTPVKVRALTPAQVVMAEKLNMTPEEYAKGLSPV